VGTTTTESATIVVTVDVENTALENALRAIAQQAGLRLFVPGDNALHTTRVTLHVRNAPVLSALSDALAGTAFRASIVAKTIVVTNTDGAGRAAPGEITGTVVDAKSKTPLRGVAITVDNAKKGITTDGDGRFRLTGVEGGAHTIHTRLIGYGRITQSVVVKDGESVELHLMLTPSVNTLDQVVVTGSVIPTELRSIPNAITVITAKELEQRGITHIDQLFRGDVPGLWVQDQGSQAVIPGQVKMVSRGGTTLTQYGGMASGLGQTIKTYVDGIELADPSLLGLIDPKSIERIEILTGPQASTVYGSGAMNGVMQVFTKRGTTSRPQLTLNVTGGGTLSQFGKAVSSNHSADTRLEGVDGHLSYNLGGGWNYVGPWTTSTKLQTINGAIGARLQQGPITIDGTYRNSLGKNWIGGAADAGFTSSQANGTIRVSGAQNYKNKYTGIVEQLGQTLGGTVTYTPMSWWSHTFTTGVDLENMFGHQSAPQRTWLDDSLVTVNRTLINRSTYSYGTTVRTTLLRNTVLTIAAGADGTHSETGNEYGDGSASINGQYTRATVLFTPYHEHGAYLQSQLGIFETLTFTYGMRVQYNQDYGAAANPNIVPRYGVTYVLDFGALTMKLRGSYGHSTRPPLRGERDAVLHGDPQVQADFGGPGRPVYGQLANLNLLPEEQRGGEGGLELYWGNRGSVQVTRYNQTVTNLILSAQGVDSLLRNDGNPDPHGYCAAYGQFYCNSIYGGTYFRQDEKLNMGDIRNQGWELQTTSNAGPLTFRVTYSWMKSRVIGVTPKWRRQFPQFVPGQSFQEIPEHTYAFATTYARGRTTLTYNLQGQGIVWGSKTGGIGGVQDHGDDLMDAIATLRLQNMNPRVTGLPRAYRARFLGYAKADVNLTQHLMTRFDATVQLNNVMNSYRGDFSNRFTVPGRTANVGLRCRL